VHAFCIGIFADHDRLAEGPLRSLGVTLKGIVAAIICIVRRREYRCRLDFLPATAMTEVERSAKGYSDPRLLPPVESGDGKHRWRRLEGSFVGLNSFNTNWAAADVNMCPHAERDCGASELLVVQAPSRFQMVKGFWGLEDGSHLSFPFFEVYRAERWRFTPLELESDRLRTSVDLSGEQFELCKASCVIHQGMACVLAVGE
jgi:hypothetical protein